MGRGREEEWGRLGAKKEEQGFQFCVIFLCFFFVVVFFLCFFFFCVFFDLKDGLVKFGKGEMGSVVVGGKVKGELRNK